MPNAPFNRYTGSGTGTINNGKPNTYYATWVLVDNGEPGNNDTFSLTIWKANAAGTGSDGGAPLITFSGLHLDMGNHQAH